MTEKDKKEIFETVNEILAYLDAIRTITVSDVAMREFSVKCCKKILQILKKDNEENNLPRPVIRDGNGKLIKDYTPRDFYLKLQEEFFEVVDKYRGEFDFCNDFDFDEEDFLFTKTAEKIADVITVCISYLNAIGYDEKGRSEIFRRVNEKNEKRGYFKEAGLK